MAYCTNRVRAEGRRLEKEKCMDIVYASSDLYSRIGLVSIKSLLENNRHVEKIRIFYIENNIGEDNKKALYELAAEYQRELCFIPMHDLSRYSSGLVRTNVVVYSYCFLHELLPKDIEKVLLIECDTLVLGSLEKLWNLDITQAYLAAADDIKSNWYKRALGMDTASEYVNSGIMLINLKKWRADDITGKMSLLLLEGNSKCFYEVQDELNVLFEGNIEILKPKYNCTTALFLYRYRNMKRYRKPSTCFTEYDYQEAVHSPVIVHFTTNQIIQSRPWIEGCTHPYKDKYLEYRSETVTSNDRLWESSRKAKNKIAYGIYRILPQCITSAILGCVQAYLYPMKEYYSKQMIKKRGYS